MSAPDETDPSDTLVAHWKDAIGDATGVHSEETLQLETIGHRTPVETFERQNTLGVLPRIVPDEDVSEFDIHRTIGQGGMGLVRLARQKSLWRDVAIKTVLPDQQSEEATRDLLREAWVTGRLEHPNIVPIHALGLDEQEAPMMVMTQVEGVTWRAVLEGEAELPEPLADGRHELENHLQILLQLCNAVQFAHSKGIVHCDLKPENVMLGEYGQVYLLDWGVAVSLEEDPSGRLPLAEDVDDVAGTPAFAAPELAGGEGTQIGRWTDVYLLGAVLHRVVTGEPRHHSPTALSTLVQAYRSEPVDYDETVPGELADICNRATHVDPEERFQNVEAFRQRIADFLRHRESRRLAAEASDRLDVLEGRLSEVMSDDEDAVAEIYRLFNECRFGFEQALSVWRGNQSARRGLHRALETMVEFELYQRDDQAAALLIDDLPHQTPQLDERLAELREELEEEARERERHEQISHDVDISLASRQRSIMCVLLGVIFGGTPFLNHWMIEQGWASMAFQDYFTQYAAVMVCSGLVVGLMRERLFKNAINARIVISVFVILGGCLIMRILGFMLGLGPPGCIVLENGLLAFSMVMLAIAIDKRIWPAGIAFLVGAIGGAQMSEQVLYFDGASNGAALWIVAFIWRHPGD